MKTIDVDILEKAIKKYEDTECSDNSTMRYLTICEKRSLDRQKIIDDFKNLFYFFETEYTELYNGLPSKEGE